MDPSPPFHVDVDRARREVVISGELDYATRSSVTDSTTELNDAGPGDIGLDLDAVTFIDASAVGAIVAADNEQTRRHTLLNVRSSSGVVRRVFALCGLSKLLNRSRTRPSG